MPAHARAERTALADLLAARGPDEPTLCAGWTTYDLAAHVVARDRRPLSLPGLVLPPLAGLTERSRRGVRRAHPYEELVSLVRAGAPVWSPVGLPGAAEASGVIEFFVHHEDVRRAADGWSPRELPGHLEEALWGRLRGMARLTLRRAPVGVVLRRPDGAEVVARDGDPRVVVSGQVGELALWVTGRRGHAQVECDGEPGAVRRLRGRG
ncbi:TIGR03085 family metal-binding protein [soil metagenome]